MAVTRAAPASSARSGGSCGRSGSCGSSRWRRRCCDEDQEGRPRGGHGRQGQGRDRNRHRGVPGPEPGRGAGREHGEEEQEGDQPGSAWRQGRRHHHPGGVDPCEQRAAGGPGDQAPGSGGIPDQRGRHEGPRPAAEREGNLMAIEAPARPRLKDRYLTEIAPALMDEFKYGNVMQIPRLTKIVVNMGVGEAARDAKLIDGAVRDLAAITGQKPAVARAKKSVAQFKLREGMPIGAHVTLRGDRMWEFLDRLLSIALPRIRDFRGLSDRQFDGRGNYTFGLTEQLMFHEIDPDKVDRQRGMDITVVTTATNDAEGRSLLRRLGFPFRESETAAAERQRYAGR